jgi:hypothetical protein
VLSCVEELRALVGLAAVGLLLRAADHRQDHQLGIAGLLGGPGAAHEPGTRGGAVALVEEL